MIIDARSGCTRPLPRCPTAGTARCGSPASTRHLELHATGRPVGAAGDLLGVRQRRGHGTDRGDDGHGGGVVHGHVEAYLELPVGQGVAGARGERVREDGRDGVALSVHRGAVDTAAVGRVGGATSVRGRRPWSSCRALVPRTSTSTPRGAGGRGVPRRDELGEGEHRARRPGRPAVHREGHGGPARWRRGRHRVDDLARRREEQLGAGPRPHGDVAGADTLLRLGGSGRAARHLGARRLLRPLWSGRLPGSAGTRCR